MNPQKKEKSSYAIVVDFHLSRKNMDSKTRPKYQIEETHLKFKDRQKYKDITYSCNGLYCKIIYIYIFSSLEHMQNQISTYY